MNQFRQGKEEYRDFMVNRYEDFLLRIQNDSILKERPMSRDLI